MLIWFCEIALENNNESLIHQLSTRQLTRYRRFCALSEPHSTSTRAFSIKEF